MVASVTNNTGAHRFELIIEGQISFIDYHIEFAKSASECQQVYVLTHTEVPESLSGRGVGSKLAAGALDIIRQLHGKVRSECSFVSRYLARHNDHKDILAL